MKLVDATPCYPLYYIATERTDWELNAFFASGDALLQQYVDPWLRKSKLDTARSTALEIGGGVGRLSRGLSHRFANVVAFDISPKMVAGGQKLNADRPNLKFVANQGNDFPGLAEESCDFVLCVWVFQHIPNFETIDDYLREIARVLTPNGSFLAQIQAPHRPWPYGAIRNSLVTTGRWTQLLALFNKDATLTKAFPGLLVSVVRFRQMCRTNQLEVLEVVQDGKARGSYWVYGQRLKEHRPFGPEAGAQPFTDPSI
jgi:SAM-dependent methyltransferase